MLSGVSAVTARVRGVSAVGVPSVLRGQVVLGVIWGFRCEDFWGGVVV